MNSLKLYYKCNPVLINCIFKQNSLEFAISFEYLTNNSKFQYLCHLEINFNSSLEIFNNSFFNNFQFLLISKKAEKNIPNVLKSEIFNLLFENTANFDRVLLISPSDGFIYWYPIFSTKQHDFSNKLNNFVLCNVDSQVVLIETFKLNDLNPLDALIKNNSKSDVSKNCHNCLIVVAKSGRIFSYSFKSTILYKISVLAHSVVFCLKVKYSENDYLIYSTNISEIFAVLLEDLVKNSSPKSIFLTKAKSIKKLKKNKDIVYYLEQSGKVCEINLKNIFSSEKCTTSSDSCDMQMVNILLEKLSIKSSKIVEGQIQIDRLNSAIKQLSILQANRHGLCKNFEISKIIKNHKIELIVQNKNILLEDTNNFYSILCCIRCEKSYGDFPKAFIWQNYLEEFNATKAGMEQILDRNFTKLIKLKMYPSQIKLYLIFNIQKFLHSNISLMNNQVKFEDEIIEKMGDFCVPIYSSNFYISDFLLPVNCSEKIVESSANFLMNVFLRKNIKDKFKLNNQWNFLEVEGFLSDFKGFDSKRKLSLFNLELSVKKTNQEKMVLKFEVKNHQKNEIFSDLSGLIYAKNCLIIQNIALRKAYATTKLKISQREMLESIVCKIEDLMEQKNNHLDHENKIAVNESFNLSFNKANKFYSIETLLNLVQIYIDIRQLLYSKIEIN